MINGLIHLARTLASLLMLAAVAAPAWAAHNPNPTPPTAEETSLIQAALPERPTVAPQEPRRLLVFWRSEGFFHSVIPYANEALRRMGEKSGAFTTEITDSYDVFTPERLAGFDAILFNNSTRLVMDDTARQAVLDYVRGGGGIVGLHAATDCFYDWPEMADLMGGMFDGHPWTAKGTWAVKIDEPDHPLNAAFEGKNFAISDEIYQVKGAYSRDRLRVLLSLDMSDARNWEVDRSRINREDLDIGISWIQLYGKGRVFYCSLGHNHDVMWNPAVMRHYLDGIQWALGDLEADAVPSAQAAPAPSLSRWDFGAEPAELAVLEAQARAGDQRLAAALEQRLLGVLADDGATFAAAQFACRLLRQVGTAQSVPALAELLAEERLGHMARLALQAIPDAAAGEALVDALARLEGAPLAGVISSLGMRREAAAVDPLAELARSPEPLVARAAVEALGRIGNDQALWALTMLASQGSAPELWPDAMLACAEQLTQRGDHEGAGMIYRRLMGAEYPDVIRQGALAALARSEGAEPASILLAALSGGDPAMNQAALTAIVAGAGRPRTTRALADGLGLLAPEAQVLLLGALAERGDAIALFAAIEALAHPEPSVRIAALEAVGRLGGAPQAPLLAAALAAEPDEAKAAAEALALLRGQDVDRELARLLERAEPKPAVALLRVLEERHAIDATGAMLTATTHPSREVGTAAWRALGAVATPNVLPVLLERLQAAPDELPPLERAYVQIARRQPDPSVHVQRVLAAMPAKPDASSVALLRLGGAIGGPAAFEALNKAARGNEPALREVAIASLAEWADDSPSDALLALASVDDEACRAAALQGYLRLTASRAADRPATATLVMLDRARPLSIQPAEKRQLLGTLGQVKSVKALDQILPFLADREVSAEAGAAAFSICTKMDGESTDTLKLTLERIMTECTDADIVKRARERLNPTQPAEAI